MSDPQEVKFCSVILDTAIDKPLDYSLPEELVSKAKVGMRVEIPVRGKICKGTHFVVHRRLIIVLETDLVSKYAQLTWI